VRENNESKVKVAGFIPQPGETLKKISNMSHDMSNSKTHDRNDLMFLASSHPVPAAGSEAMISGLRA
jgi:hypothetical protein